tara:strand:+ start:1013 stop:1741 length:729 start_codon:yes stop_codon:yes gene_type:complete
MQSISKEKLASWGLFKKFSIEQIIDIKTEEIYVEDSFKNSIIEEWIKSNQIKSNEGLEKWKKVNGLNNEEFIQFVIRAWKWREWCKSKFEKEIPSYYLKRKTLLDSVTYSLLRVKNENLALELYLRIKENEFSFKEIASNFSEGPESKTGGLIGPIPMKNVPLILSKLFQISKSGQIWQPRKIEEWWIIVRLEKIKSTKLDDNIKNLLSIELGNDFLNKEFERINQSNNDQFDPSETFLKKK